MEIFIWIIDRNEFLCVKSVRVSLNNKPIWCHCFLFHHFMTAPKKRKNTHQLRIVFLGIDVVCSSNRLIVNSQFQIQFVMVAPHKDERKTSVLYFDYFFIYWFIDTISVRECVFRRLWCDSIRVSILYIVMWCVCRSYYLSWNDWNT